MEPDPALYLLGARRALQKIIERGQVRDSTSVITLERAAETLAQLALRQAVLPPILEQAADAQEAVLQDAVALLREVGDDGEGGAQDAAPRDPIAAYDQRSWKFARVFRRLALHAGG